MSEDSSAKATGLLTELLEAKAPCDLKNRKRRTPYEHAIELNKPSLAKLIGKYDEFIAAFDREKMDKRKGRKSVVLD